MRGRARIGCSLRCINCRKIFRAQASSNQKTPPTSLNLQRAESARPPISMSVPYPRSFLMHSPSPALMPVVIIPESRVCMQSMRPDTDLSARKPYTRAEAWARYKTNERGWVGTERLLVGPGESGRTGAQTVPDQVLRLQKRNCLFLPAWRTVCVRKRRQKRRGLLPPAPSARGPPSRLLPVRDCRERVSRDSGIDRECVGGFDLCKLLLCARCMSALLHVVGELGRGICIAGL